MKKRILFTLLATVSLMVFSCAKEVVTEVETEEEILIDPWTCRDIANTIEPIPGDPVCVNAGFVETKSHLEMNGTDSYAQVLWDAGDSFEMYGYNSGWSCALFSTTESGGKTSFTSANVLPTGPMIHSIYAPLSDVSNAPLHIRLGVEDFGFGVNIPVNQTAVQGGIQQGLNFAYAQTASATEDLHFQNMLALVRFKITGAVVSSIKSVTLRGATPLAGECVVVPDGTGTPLVTFTKTFGADNGSTAVTLSGDFAEDKWYYFAVAPGAQSTFSLTFSNEGGTQVINKVASKSVTFNRGRITSLGSINLGSSFDGDPSLATVKYLSASAGAPKPVTIAVIPDGFTLAEMPKYEMLAKSAMNALFNVEPYKSYKEYFNVYIMKQPSDKSGGYVTDGNGIINPSYDRKPYFGSKWGAGAYSYGDMDADRSTIKYFVEANCPDITSGYHTFSEVPVLIIVNDNRYGGRCMSASDGSGYCIAPYTYDGGRIGWSYSNIGKEAASDSDPSAGVVAISAARWAEVGSNVGTYPGTTLTNAGNWLNTMVHEFGGHCFGRLGDEYWNSDTPGPVESYLNTHRWDQYTGGVPFDLNISVSYANPGYDDPGLGPEYIKPGWQHLLDRKSELVASDTRYSRIGVYQGGDTYITNRWRSERVSCMIDNRFYFSTFQRWLIVQRIMTLSGSSFNEASFWAKDDPTDPVRDIAASAVMGLEDPVPPRPMPPLPPPVLVDRF